MMQLILENLSACYLAFSGMFVGAVILIDRRNKRRWKPMRVVRGEIVEAGQ